MEIIEQLINPPTTGHVAILNIIQVIAFIMFLPFIGMFSGGSILSVYYRSKFKKTKNQQYIRFSKDIIDKLTISRNVGWGMGIIPLITILLTYSQFLYGAKVITVLLLMLSLALYIAAFVFIYNYRKTFLIEDILAHFENRTENLKDTSAGDEKIKNFKSDLLSSSVRYGNFGVALLIIAAFLFAGSICVSMDMNEWQNVTGLLNLLVNGKIWLIFIFLIAASFSISGVAILYFFFIWQGGLKNMDKEYEMFTKKTSLNISFISSIILPFLLILNFIFQPQTSLSASNFILTGISVISILLVCNLLYACIRNSEIKYSGAALFLLFIVFTFVVIQQQIAFSNSIKPHLYTVNQKADEIERQLIHKNAPVVEINAEDIYNTKCIACHKFDVKLVGPPYQETIPKYNGDVKKLAAYIFNPVKINPDYPPMPNQGLKEKEAEALAQWLINKVTAK